MDNKTPVRQRIDRSLEKIAAVNESVAKTPKTSIGHLPQQLPIARSTKRRILTNDFHLHAHKMQLTQELKPANHGKRRQFVQWVMDQSEVNANFSKKVIFSENCAFPSEKKIIEFGDQKILMQSMRKNCTHNEQLLSGADFGQAA